jgi:transposase InsO family protein
VSPSGYYGWRSRPSSARTTENQRLLGDIRRLHDRHRRRYGVPRMHAALGDEGWTVSWGRVARLMRRHGIRAAKPRSFRVCTTDGNHGLPVAPNLLDRDFSAEMPNRVWLADITYIPTDEGWLYLAVVLDLFSRKAIGWDNAPMESFFGSLKTELVHDQRYRTHEEAKRDLFAYIEGYYNRPRLHSALGYITPIQAELQAA